MRDVEGVQIADGAHDLFEIVFGFVFGKTAVILNVFEQIAVPAIIHQHVYDVFGFQDFVHLKAN